MQNKPNIIDHKAIIVIVFFFQVLSIRIRIKLENKLSFPSTKRKKEFRVLLLRTIILSCHPHEISNEDSSLMKYLLLYFIRPNGHSKLRDGGEGGRGTFPLEGVVE